MKLHKSPFIWTGNFTAPRCIWAVLFLFIATSFFEVQANDTDNDGVADNADAFPNDPLLSVQPTTVDFSTTALGGNDDALDNSLELWLDAHSVHGNLRTPTNSESITSWLDLSGNNHHAVQLTQDKRPKFSASGMNGKGVMVFDGSNDYLAILDKYYSSKSIENISIFAVVETSSTQKQMIISFDRSEFWRLALVDDLSPYHVGWDTNVSSSMNDMGSPASFADGNPHIIHSFYHKSKTPNKGINVDAALVVSGTHHSRNNLGESITRYGFVGVGSEASSFNGSIGPGIYMKGKIAELLIFESSLTQLQIARINYYLSVKWGLGANVDSDGDGVVDASDFAPTDPNVQVDLTVDMTGKPSVLSDASLKLWLDATHSNSFFKDGSNNVSKWMDLSGNNHHAANSSDYPSHLGDSVEFSYNDKLLFSNQVSIGQDWEFFVIYDFSSHDQHTGWNTLFRGSSQDHHLLIRHSDDHIGLYDNNGSDFMSSGLKVTDYSGNNLLHMSATGSTSVITINGQDSGSINKKITSALYALGNYQNGAQGFGIISEILVFDRTLLSSEYEQISHYLATKWNLTASVDSDRDGVVDLLDNEFLIREAKKSRSGATA